MLSLSIYKFKKWQLFVLYIFLITTIGWLTNSLIFTDTYYYSFFGDKFSNERIVDIIAISKKYQYMGYAISPLILLFKLGIISGAIYMGLFLLNRNLTYSDCFKIVMIAELASIVALVVRMLWLFKYRPETMQEMQFFCPLAATQIFDLKQLPIYLVYPLHQFNVFELLYWYLVAAGIQAYTKQSLIGAFKVVAATYGLVLSIWVLFVVFIQLQYS